MGFSEREKNMIEGSWDNNIMVFVQYIIITDEFTSLLVVLVGGSVRIKKLV